jgi:hypothetical protein
MMGRNALGFSRAHPDDSAGYTAALAKLEEYLNRATELTREQQEGFRRVREATATKRELRSMMTQGHLNHLIRVARAASFETPAILQRFTFTAARASHLAFLGAASDLVKAAQENRALLVTNGLSEPVLADLEEKLAKYAAVMAQDEEARRQHVGATAKLIELADLIVDVVHTMDGINRLRFANDAQTLSQWESASNVATVHPADDAGEGEVPPSATGEVKPAA